MSIDCDLSDCIVWLVMSTEVISASLRGDIRPCSGVVPVFIRILWVYGCSLRTSCLETLLLFFFFSTYKI